MVARYGDKTRVTSQVNTWGKSSAGGGGGERQFNEQTFTAPGTWTWPGNTSLATVIVVGGGGGSGAFISPSSNTNPIAGGGGGVRIETLPVSAPVPVVVGAGGTAGIDSPSTPLRWGGVGGDSSFGPFAVGGGAGGKTTTPSGVIAGMDAPANGGGGSAGISGPPLGASNAGRGGSYGYPAHYIYPGGAGGQAVMTHNRFTAAPGFLGYGAGGGRFVAEPPTVPAGNKIVNKIMQGKNTTPANTVLPNTGNGAPSHTWTTPSAPASSSGVAGSSGVVIVRWWE